MTEDRESPTDDRGGGTAATQGAVIVGLAPGSGAGIGPVVVETGPVGFVTLDGRRERARLIPGEPPRARLETAGLTVKLGAGARAGLLGLRMLGDTYPL